MPSATVPALLLDQYGRPAQFQSPGQQGTLYSRSADDDRLRPRPKNHFADKAALLAPERRKELISESRALACRGLLSALIDNKAGYVSASNWLPRFEGTDTAYGERATAAVMDWLKICNLRGSRFDWRASWKLSTRNFADAGGFFVLLTEWADTGWPALQFIEAHRVGQRNTRFNVVGKDDAWTLERLDDGSTVERKGAYTGLFIQNGIISSRVGTEVAYRVLGATPDQDQDISARDLIYVAAPKSYSESCPEPDIAHALLDFLAIDLAQTCQLDQQIVDSRLTFIEESQSGLPSVSQQVTGMAPTVSGTPTEVYERLGTRFIKSGNKLTGHESDRPSDQWMNFDKRVVGRAAAAVGWRAEMLDPEALRGSATRAFQDQINTQIGNDFHAASPAAARCVKYAVAKLTKIGVLPPHTEWMRWSIAPPPWFEVDRASAKLDIEDVAAGRVSMSDLHARDGRRSIDVLESRARLYEQAQSVHKRHPDVPLSIILGDLGITAPRSGFFPQSDPKNDNQDAATPPTQPPAKE